MFLVNEQGRCAGNGTLFLFPGQRRGKVGGEEKEGGSGGNVKKSVMNHCELDFGFGRLYFCDYKYL